jgi:hypothetical protein
MERDRRATAIVVAVLTVRAALPDEFEAEPFEDRLYLARLQHRDGAQDSGYPDRVGANELRLERWFTILQEHLYDFGQVGEELVHGGSLGMCTLPAGYVPNEQARVRVTFDNRSVVAHSDCPV